VSTNKAGACGRVTEHRCDGLRWAVAEYANSVSAARQARVELGSFGIGVKGMPRDPGHPEREEMVIYLPLARHCPYCGEAVPGPGGSGE